MAKGRLLAGPPFVVDPSLAAVDAVEDMGEGRSP